ncbi:MAG: hypothetical protein COA74_09965 [Gammaproteobacteria bacterium]|nr:MAG: hypothetical protein COA74_09965 [Gammaproteobacteria bacterium]
MSKKTHSRYIFATITCLFLGLAVFLVEQDIEKKFTSEISKSLISQARTTESAINLITTENKQTLLTVASMPTIIKTTLKLIRETKKSLALIDSAPDHPESTSEFYRLINQIKTIHNYEDYFIITPDEKVLVSSLSKSINLENQYNTKLFFDAIWQGNTLLSSPLIDQQKSSAPLRSIKKYPSTSILVGSPILNTEHKIIAAIIFSMDITEHYSAIFNKTEIGASEALRTLLDIRIITSISFLVFYLFILYLIFLFNKNEKTMINSKHKLESSKLRLRLAFENIPSGNIVSDWHGIIIEYSRSAEAIFGYTSKEMIGKNVNILMPESDHSHHDRYIKNFLSTGVHKVIGSGGRNTSGLHKNGNTVPIHICLGTMVIEYEMFFIASITDQTLQTKINKQLFDSQKMKSIGQLSSGLTHDFNNLLGIAIGNLQLLERKAALDDSSIKKVASALQALNRGASLTSQLLNFTRPDNETTGPISINDGILGIKDLIEQTATSKINIVYSLAEKLQPVHLKYGELGDVLINLTANARDAMPSGGTIFIETSTYSDETRTNKEYIHLNVRDTGEGIEAKKLSHIFEPFYTTKERSKGTGLGLAMVSNFIKKAKGKINVYSDVGVGTSFNLYFPISTQAISNAEQLKPTASLEGDETILLVDDEIELLCIAKDNLIEAGYSVIICASAEEALEALKTNHQIDLLISDIIMPTELDGFELAVKATNIKPKLKIALMSGFSASVDEKQVDGNLLAKYFARNLLQKPYTRKDLLTFVRAQLDIKQLIPWNAKFLTGIEALDDDHRALNFIVNDIYTKLVTEENPGIETLLIELDKLMHKHHQREELIFEICQTSDSKEHKDIHLQIEKRLGEYATGQLEVITSDDHEQLLTFLKTLISAHVERESIQLKYLTSEYSEAIRLALMDSM